MTHLIISVAFLLFRYSVAFPRLKKKLGRIFINRIQLVGISKIGGGVLHKRNRFGAIPNIRIPSGEI